MFCKKCGRQMPDEAAFCPGCGVRVQQSLDLPQNKRESSSRVIVVEKEKSQGVMKTIVGPAIIIIIIVFAVHSCQADPIADLKGVTFNGYGTVPLGTAVNQSLSNPKWSQTKIDSNHYHVTVSGYHVETASNISVVFDVSYEGDYVYAEAIRAIADGSPTTNTWAIAYVMGLIYGD